MIKTFNAKIANMRKERSWIAMPTSGNRIIVQTDGAIGVIYNVETCEGALTTKGGYFPHLSLYAKPFVFPREFVTAALKACPSQGGTTELAGGAVIAQNTVQEI